MGGKKAHAQWEQQVARQKTRIAQIALRLDRVGEIEEAAGVYAERKIEELAERKLRFDKPELAQKWDKIQRRQRQALIGDYREHSKPRPGPWKIIDALLEQQTKNARVHESTGLLLGVAVNAVTRFRSRWSVTGLIIGIMSPAF